MACSTKFDIDYNDKKTSNKLKKQAKDLHGHLAVSMDGTSAHRISTIYATQHISQKQEANKSRTQYISYPP